VQHRRLTAELRDRLEVIAEAARILSTGVVVSAARTVIAVASSGGRNQIERRRRSRGTRSERAKVSVDGTEKQRTQQLFYEPAR
jgi:hypothetical protein